MKKVVFSDSPSSHVKAISERDELIWKNLANISLHDAATQFLNTLTGNTQRSYRTALNMIFILFIQQRLFCPDNNLQTLALSNLEFILDEIRSKIPGSSATKQARAAAFIAFTRYLQRSTGGIIRRVVPKRENLDPTFQQIRETATTKSLSKIQWTQFLQSLKRMSFRDYLVAKTIIQGAKRISEVLSAKIEQIDWEKKQIIFKQLKSKKLEKYTIITYPDSFIIELKNYIGERKSGPIFVTRNNKPLSQPHVYRIFAEASLDAGIPFIVHPHVLRASAITHLTRFFRRTNHESEWSF